MLVVIASRHDETSRTLTDRWRAQNAHLLTCEDLSLVGWRHHLGIAEFSTAVINGRVVATEEITGVLTRLPCVNEHELTYIVPADRAYVAAEMTAFLAAWLSGLACPILNQPTPTCLIGPNWRPEQWVHAAARLGIPVCPVRRRVALTADFSAEVPERRHATITIVGDRCFGEVDGALAAQARRLAAAAKVDLLAVHFSGPEAGARMLSADLWPDISSPDIADAILDYLSGGPRC
jgi:hypothetical protein